MEILDVTQLEPRIKHSTIFSRFDSLLKGEELVIENDHDPKPLYYQLLAERGPVFGWDYLEAGPQVWRVSISKILSNQAEPSIGEIVAQDWRKAEILKKYGIDFCCGGKRTVREACTKQAIDFAQVNRELQQAENDLKDHGHQFNLWELDFLIDYIINNHHAYVSKSIPFLYELGNKVSAVHSNQHPELIQINQHLQALLQELSLHMRKEEVILFPYIKSLVHVRRNNTSIEAAPFGSIGNPIHQMEEEHTAAGDAFVEIKRLSNHYSLPTDACNSYRILYAKLAEFEQDLQQHIHLENNILFPKALLMEEKGNRS
jgi:regulator of cell morphogenesis and NO signaling